jgi:hypothetical protein
MKISRTPRAKNSAAERVSLRDQIFGLRTSARPRAQIPKPDNQIQKSTAARRAAAVFWRLDVWNFVICAPQARILTPRLHRRSRADWLCPCSLSARWEFVMRNRSATVAGFHGLSWFPKVSKERQELFPKLK